MSDLRDKLVTMPDKNLLVTLSYLLDRRVSAQEVADVLGVHRSTVYGRKGSGTLCSMDNLAALADHYELNKIDLLLRFGHLTQNDLTEAFGSGEVQVVDPPKVTSRTRIRQRGHAWVIRSDAPPL